MILRSQDVGVECAYCYLSVDPPIYSQWTELSREGIVCVCTHVWAESQEFMLILAISIWHHSIHSSFLPFHIFNSLLRQWKIWHLLSLICINPLICNHCQHHPFPHPVASLKFWLWHPAQGLSLWCDVLFSLCWRLAPGYTPAQPGHPWPDSDPSW